MTWRLCSDLNAGGIKTSLRVGIEFYISLQLNSPVCISSNVSHFTTTCTKTCALYHKANSTFLSDTLVHLADTTTQT